MHISAIEYNITAHFSKVTAVKILTLLTLVVIKNTVQVCIQYHRIMHAVMTLRQTRPL